MRGDRTPLGTGVSDAQSGTCQNPQKRHKGELYCVQILLIKKQDPSAGRRKAGGGGNEESESSWGHRDAFRESGWDWLGGVHGGRVHEPGSLTSGNLSSLPGDVAQRLPAVTCRAGRGGSTCGALRRMRGRGQWRRASTSWASSRPGTCCGLHAENRPKGERKGNYSTMKGTRLEVPSLWME